MKTNIEKLFDYLSDLRDGLNKTFCKDIDVEYITLKKGFNIAQDVEEIYIFQKQLIASQQEELDKYQEEISDLETQCEDKELERNEI